MKADTRGNVRQRESRSPRSVFIKAILKKLEFLCETYRQEQQHKEMKEERKKVTFA